MKRSCVATRNTVGTPATARPNTAVYSLTKFGVNAFSEGIRQELIGQRVQGYWSGDGVWFAGKVTKYDARNRQHTVRYDDGQIGVVVVAEGEDMPVRIEKRGPPAAGPQ